MKKYLLFLFLLFICLSQVFATHNRAGEITYKHLYGNTYKITLLTYTYAPSPADRPELEVFWGDGTSDTLPRVQKIDLTPVMRKNVYEGIHTYGGPGTFVISLMDPNRNGGVVNILNSINTPFYIETVLIINPFFIPNNSPILTFPPIDDACLYKPFIHNPGAYDIDGDSLSYTLIPCKRENGLDIIGYTYPTANNIFTLNPITGDLLWDSPIQAGEYNVAILIEEWRYGYKMGSIIRDMQISVVQCNNDPPIIDPILDTCVEAGALLQFNVHATDVNMDKIILTATGGPIVMTNSPAQFPQNTYGYGSVTAPFIWQTECSHVRKQPYHVNFKATDDGNGTPVKLTDIETVNITIIGPAPKNLTANPQGNSIELSWNISECDNAVGYKIYRRNSYYGFFPDYCETGVPAYTGYSQIDKTQNINDTVYTDNNHGIGLVHGVDYCYMVVAFYPDDAESYASLEACTTLIKDIPIITNVSINHTDNSNGSAYIAWSKPTELDTIQIPGPYKYLINRSEGLQGTFYQLIDSLNNLNDTIFSDTLINTKNNIFNYRIDFYNDEPANRFFVGSTQIAQSIFINLTPGDNKLILSWSNNVPWTNDKFVVYRQNPITLQFDSIGWTSDTTYTDINLINGKEYCYKIKSIGNYSASGIINPIINFSQENCETPQDLEKPCAPILHVETNCLTVENTLIWSNPNNFCSDDVVKYDIYYSSVANGDFTIISTNNYPEDTTFVHSNLTSIAGCYTIVAIDSFMNQSNFSNIVCIDIDVCDLYSLPNVFTPNGDGTNDYYTPFPYSFVDHIDLEIFNRWGQIVFTSIDPDINWDGKNKNNGDDVSDGVYFYVCDVYEYRLEGIVKRTITGYVHVYRK